MTENATRRLTYLTKGCLSSEKDSPLGASTTELTDVKVLKGLLAQGPHGGRAALLPRLPKTLSGLMSWSSGQDAGVVKAGDLLSSFSRSLFGYFD